MSTTSKWSESSLPAVREQLQSLAGAGPVDTAPLFAEPHAVPDVAVEALRITGRDRVRFLHAMLSNDVMLLDKAGPGHGIRATLNSVQGRLVADAHLYLVDADKKTGSMLALFEPGAGAAFVEMLDRYVIAEKVFFEPEEIAAVAVVGPGAAEALAGLGLEVDEGEHRHGEGTLGGAAVRIIRRDLGAPDGHLVLCARDQLDAVVSALGLAPATPSQLEAARIEAGLPRPGGDVTSINIVLEGGLKDRAMSFTKGCYIGQEVICRLDSMGTPARLLVQLEASEAPAPGTELFDGPKSVGWVTSSVASQRKGAAVFLGYVKKRSNDVGSSIAVGAADGPAATITAHV